MKAAAHENLWGGVNERGPTLSCRGVERGIVVIPKSVTASRIAANRDLFGFALDDEVGGTSTCHSLVHSLDLRGVHVSLVHSLDLRGVHLSLVHSLDLRGAAQLRPTQVCAGSIDAMG